MDVDFESDEQDDLFGQRIDDMEDRISVAIEEYHRKRDGAKVERLVRYSAFSEDDQELPIDNLDEVAVQGIVAFEECLDHKWLTEEEKINYRSECIANPTWLQVAIFANEMIHALGYEEHVFLEAVVEERKEGEVTIMSFLMGS